MGFDKLKADVSGMKVLTRSVLAFELNEEINEIIVVLQSEKIEYWRVEFKKQDFKKIKSVLPGGSTRQQSVCIGVGAVSADAQYVCVHDGARPLVSRQVIHDALKTAKVFGAAAPGIPVVDTIKMVENGIVVATPERYALYCIQTPQVFEKQLITYALKDRSLDYGDESQLLETSGHLVAISKGDENNLKITRPKDIKMAELIVSDTAVPSVRIGHGYDVHRLSADRDLIIGGVKIAHQFGLSGHSDADVLLHAIIDALLGGAALGDIGRHFPDTRAELQNISSRILLQSVVDLLKQNRLSVLNIDATIVAQKPKLADYIPQMTRIIAADCGIDISRVNLKATTEEGLGFTGNEQGIAAHAVCLLYCD
jgi:2-C-methyl-D-erythritol 2,4-cyclodiphosphate synthase/2-C-methyl-D-erythritol 4-phosphate cytidylyltransferase